MPDVWVDRSATWDEVFRATEAAMRAVSGGRPGGCFNDWADELVREYALLDTSVPWGASRAWFLLNRHVCVRWRK